MTLGGGGTYRQRSQQTSRLLQQLFNTYQGDSVMPFTWEDFEHWYIKDHFPKLTSEEQREALEQLSPEQRRELLHSLPTQERREVLESLPPEERLAGLSAEQIRQYLDQMTARRPTQPRKPRQKK